LTKLDMTDYVRGPTPRDNFGEVSSTLLVWAHTRLVTSLSCFSFFLLFCLSVCMSFILSFLLFLLFSGRISWPTGIIYTPKRVFPTKGVLTNSSSKFVFRWYLFGSLNSLILDKI